MCRTLRASPPLGGAARGTCRTAHRSRSSAGGRRVYRCVFGGCRCALQSATRLPHLSPDRTSANQLRDTSSGTSRPNSRTCFGRTHVGHTCAGSRQGVTRGGHIDRMGQVEIRSARRSETPKQPRAKRPGRPCGAARWALTMIRRGSGEKLDPDSRGPYGLRTSRPRRRMTVNEDPIVRASPATAPARRRGATPRPGWRRARACVRPARPQR